MGRFNALSEDGQELSTITHSDHGAHSSIQPNLVGDEVRWEDGRSIWISRRYLARLARSSLALGSRCSRGWRSAITNG